MFICPQRSIPSTGFSLHYSYTKKRSSFCLCLTEIFLITRTRIVNLYMPLFAYQTTSIHSFPRFILWTTNYNVLYFHYHGSVSMVHTLLRLHHSFNVSHAYLYTHNNCIHIQVCNQLRLFEMVVCIHIQIFNN